jgi:nitrogen fixation protein FixH
MAEADRVAPASVPAEAPPPMSSGSSRKADDPVRPRPRAGWQWPVIVVTLLVGGVGVNIGMMLAATGDASFAVESNYYQKALRWDETMAQEARNAALGWSVAAALERTAGPVDVRLRVRLHDRTGRPIEGARVTVETFHSARAASVLTGALGPEAPGEYAAALPLGRPGVWEVRLRAERGDQIFTTTLVQELARTP